MSLSDNEKRILAAFMQLIPRLDQDVINRITIALNNEQRVKAYREALMERLTEDGKMSREDAEREIVKFQRLLEGSNANRDSVYNEDVNKKQAVKKKFVEQQIDVAEPVKLKNGKEKIDPIDNMIEELDIPEK